MGIQKNQTDNRAFLEMLKPAKERLAGRTAEEIASNTKMAFDTGKSEFLLSGLGEDMRISYPGYEIMSEINEWYHLVILHYMDMADGAALSPDSMAFGELKDGMVRGGGFDRRCERTISQHLGNQPMETVRKACESLGAEIVSSNADLCAVFHLLPLYPVTLKIWFADEDIEGSGRMLLNGSADHFLTVEDAVTVGSVILDAVVSRCKELVY